MSSPVSDAEVVPPLAATPLAVVQAWHDALNAQDFARFASLLAADVEFAGPKGTGRGAAMVREWAKRAGVQLHPRRWFQREGDVVVAQQARWRDPTTGEWGEPLAVATVFRVEDGLVRRVARCDTLPQALAVAGLAEATETTSPRP